MNQKTNWEWMNLGIRWNYGENFIRFFQFDFILKFFNKKPFLESVKIEILNLRYDFNSINNLKMASTIIPSL